MMTTRTATQPEPPPVLRCPRCGYDVSGPVSTWADACPVEGRCTECGLTFRWGDVFDPLRDIPAWFFEHAPPRRARPLLATMARTCAPWRFWRTITLSMPIRPGRVAVFALGVGAVCYLIPLAFHIGALFLVYWLDYRTLAGALSEVRWYVRDALFWPGGMFYDANFPILLIWIVAGLVMPCCFVTLPTTLGKAKVRPLHFVRAGVYSTAPTVVVASAWAIAYGVASLLYSYTSSFDWVGVFIDEDLWWPWFWPLWILLSWWCVCRFYLRIPHALGVAFLLLIMALLLTPFVAFGVGLFLSLFV